MPKETQKRLSRKCTLAELHEDPRDPRHRAGRPRDAELREQAREHAVAPYLQHGVRERGMLSPSFRSSLRSPEQRDDKPHPAGEALRRVF